VLKGVLRRWQSRFPEAIRLFRRAVSIWLSAGETRSAVEALTSWALLHEDEGETDVAIHLLRGATAVAGSDIEPRLALMLQHNLAVCLVDQDRFLEAQAVLIRSRALYCAVADPTISLRRQWLEATIARAFGQCDRASGLLRIVRDGFLSLGNGYEPALISLQLALLNLETGHFVEAEELAGEAFEVFRAQRVVRDGLAAMILIRQAAARQPALLAS
jgi:tetratricopeptide (TPR) repeat protein